MFHLDLFFCHLLALFLHEPLALNDNYAFFQWYNVYFYSVFSFSYFSKMTDLESNEVDVHFESNAFLVSWYLKYFEFLHGTIFCLSFPALITEGIRVILQIELTY